MTTRSAVAPPRCSYAILTARSHVSSENLFGLLMIVGSVNTRGDSRSQQGPDIPDDDACLYAPSREAFTKIGGTSLFLTIENV